MGMSSAFPRIIRSNFSDLARKNFKFEFRAATENDREEIVRLLRKSFFPHNPLAMYSKLISEDNRVCEEFEKYTIKPLIDNPSWNVVATHEKAIIGVFLNREVNRENYYASNVPNVKSTNYATFVNFWRHVRLEMDLYGKFPDVDKVFLIQSSCVDPRFRKQRVGDGLTIKTLNIAKQLGYKLIMGECVNVYAAEGCRGYGCQSIYTLKYEDYKVNNQRIFKPSPPQDRVEIFVLKI